MNIIRKKQSQLFISFLLIIAFFVSLIIALFLTSWEGDIKLSLLLLLLIIMLFILFWFKPRLFYYSQQYSFLKMKNFQGNLIQTKQDISSQKWVTHLVKKSFKVFASNDRYTVLHRYTRDATNFLTKNPMLEIIIIIYDEILMYDDQDLAHIINLIEDDYTKKKQRFKNYTILRFKMGNEMPSEFVSEIDQVVFDTQAGKHITVINGYYASKTHEVYFLYSDLYYPTAHYKYGVDLMKEII